MLVGCAEGQFLHLGGLESHPPQRHPVGGVGGEGAHAHAAHHVGEEQSESEGVAVADSQHRYRRGRGRSRQEGQEGSGGHVRKAFARHQQTAQPLRPALLEQSLEDALFLHDQDEGRVLLALVQGRERERERESDAIIMREGKETWKGGAGGAGSRS